MTNTWKYVGAHDAVDIDGIGTLVAGTPFEANLDLSGRDDFELVAGDQGNGPAVGENPDLSGLTVPQLRELAAAAGIEHKGLKKPALIAVLTDKES